MKMTAAMTQGKPWPEMALGMGFKMLERFEFVQIYTAVMNHIQSNRFMPQVADIVQAIEGTVSERSSLEWAKVLKAAQLHGTYKSVCFSDPRIHYAIQRMGGWPAIGKIDIDDLKWAAKEFDKYFAEADKLHVNWNNVPQTLLGHTDMVNYREGRELMEPISVEKYIAPPAVVPQIEPPKPEGKLIPVNIDFSKIGKKI